MVFLRDLWTWFNFSVEFQPYFTNPFVADSDNDGLSDKLELKYGTNPFCNDTDHDGLPDINETGRFVDEVRDNSPDWNNSSQHSPGIYFNDLNETIGTGKNVSATANFNFTVDVTGLSPEKELPKPVTVTAILQGQLPKEYFVVSSYYGVLYDENNNTIASESKEDWNDSYAVLTFRFDFNATTTTRYYVSIIWNYSILADKPERYPPRIDITLKFGEKETTTDPLDVDTDHDCVADGADTNPFDPLAFPESPFADNDGDGLLNWEEENIGTDKNKADTDGDGLSDFEELRVYGTNASNPDTDKDGIGDYAEIFIYKTDPNKASSDSDNLTDSQEIFITNTDPWKEDTDGDGLYDDTEYTLGLNPLSNDTDSDQWLDAQEFQYWYILYLEMGMNEKDACAQAAKNCQTPDVDGDSITDYQEVFGYNVKIITGWDSENRPISKEITMYGDPLRAYRQSSGAWTDTDSDGIPDIVEIYFSNVSYIDNDNLWQQMIVSTGFDSAYGWCRDYYLELNATSKDMSKPESEREDARSKAENWTQKAFNPFVVYNMPPTIAKWSASVREYHTSSGTIYTIQTEFVVRDIGGIKEVNQKIVELMTGKVVAEHTYIPEARYTEITAGWEFTVDYWTLKTQGYRAVGETTNYAGYSVEASKEIKGLIAIAIDALQALWQMLAGGLQKVWEAVEKAVTTLRAWVMEKLEYLLGLWASGFVQTIKTLPEEVLGINISAFLSLDLTKVTVDQILLFIGELLFVLLTARMYSDLLIGILLLFSPFYLSLMISPEDVYVNIDNKMKEQVAIEYPNFEKTLHKLELWDILFGFILPFLLLSGIKYLMIGFYEKNPVLIVGAAIVVIISLVGLAIILIKLKDP